MLAAASGNLMGKMFGGTANADTSAFGKKPGGGTIATSMKKKQKPRKGGMLRNLGKAMIGR